MDLALPSLFTSVLIQRTQIQTSGARVRERQPTDSAGELGRLGRRESRFGTTRLSLDITSSRPTLLI